MGKHAYKHHIANQMTAAENG